MPNHYSTKFSCSIIIGALFSIFSSTAMAQESAYADLDACTKNEQIKLTAKGAAAGALTGLGAAFLTGKKNDAGKAALLGAVAGGAIGYAKAYYSAIDTCYKLNPSWVPESKLVRDPAKSYQQVIKEHRYSPKEGIKSVIKQVEVAPTAKPGTPLDINTTFDVMTPDGAETPVVIERKLFVIDAGKEEQILFPGASAQGRTFTVAPGRQADSVKLPIGADAKSGTVYRIDVSVAAGGKPADVVSRSVTVQ